MTLVKNVNMGCCPGTSYATEEQKFGVIPTTICSSITVDLLELYKRPIDCYLTYHLWNEIGSSELELQNAAAFLQKFINMKTADEEDCSEIASLSIVRSIVDKIIKKGICL
jgi:hypothetical protein